MTWIIGQTPGAKWHLGVQKPYSYDEKRWYWATACTGKQIGGPWGATTYRGPGRPSELENLRCVRCEKLANQQEQTA